MLTRPGFTTNHSTKINGEGQLTYRAEDQMFTEVSLTLLAETDRIVEIKYDFISDDDKINFSMGTLNYEEKSLEKFVTEGEKEN